MNGADYRGLNWVDTYERISEDLKVEDTIKRKLPLDDFKEVQWVVECHKVTTPKDQIIWE